MVTRRRVLQHGLVAGAAALLAPRVGFAAANWSGTLEQAKKEGAASYYSSSIAKVEEPLMAQFGSAAGINVQYSRPGGGEIVLRKYEQELKGNAATADICGLTDYALGLYAKSKGYTAAPDLPNVAKLDKVFSYRDPGIYSTGGFCMAICVNNNMIPEGKGPTKYTDLIDPKYKDQILFGAPENAGSTTLLIKGLVERHGWDFVKALRANNLSEMRLQAEAMQAVSRGEKPICVVAQAWGYLNKLQGAPIRIVIPSDGVVVAETCVFISKSSPRPAAAAVLANFLLSAEYQEGLVKKAGFYASNRDAAPPSGLPPLSSLNVYSPNLVELSAQRGTIIETWRKIMS